MGDSPKTVVVYGPPGSGKTRHAPELLARFGCLAIVDPWDGRSPLRRGDLALTQCAPPYRAAVDLSVPFEAHEEAAASASPM